MRVDPHSSKAYVFLMTVEAVWLVVAGLSVCVCGVCVALVPHSECGIILCTAAVFLLRPAVGFRWPLGVKHSGVTQLCLNMFTTADHEPLLGLLHCSEALAWLPVAGAGQEVDEEADGKSAMRIWKTVLFLSAALLCDSAVCHAFWTFWAAYCPCWGAVGSVQHIEPLSFKRCLSDQIVFSCCNETVGKFSVVLCW